MEDNKNKTDVLIDNNLNNPSNNNFVNSITQNNISDDNYSNINNTNNSDVNTLNNSKNLISEKQENNQKEDIDKNVNLNQKNEENNNQNNTSITDNNIAILNQLSESRIKLEKSIKKSDSMTFLILSIIFLVISTITFCFYTAFICGTIEGIILTNAGNTDFGTGLQKAFGLVFAIIAGVATIIFSIVNLICSIISLKLAEGKVKTTNKIFIIIASVFIFLTIVSFVIVRFLV